MEIGKKTLFIMALTLVLAAIAPVAAYMYIWETEPQQIQSGIILTTVEMPPAIYWDENCTEPVTTIDFGEIAAPGSEGKTLTKWMYIRNEWNVSRHIYWNSTLSSVTTEITESWKKGGFNWNGTEIGVGVTWTTNYQISIEPYPTVGTYNWTLTVWAGYPD